jgi:hypothetical protein
MFIELDYKIRNDGAEWESVTQKYPIVKTQCNFGGGRYWFKCSIYKNGGYCGKRVAKLYLGHGSKYFACRACYGLTYASRIQGYSYTFVDLDEFGAKIKRWYYRGKATRKHRHFMKMEEAIQKDMRRNGFI